MRMPYPCLSVLQRELATQVRLWGEHGYFARLTKLVIENEKELESELEAHNSPDPKKGKKAKTPRNTKKSNIKVEDDTVEVRTRAIGLG